MEWSSHLGGNEQTVDISIEQNRMIENFSDVDELNNNLKEEKVIKDLRKSNKDIHSVPLSGRCAYI